MRRLRLGPLLLRHPLIAPEIKARMAEITKRFAPTGKEGPVLAADGGPR